MSRNLKCIFCKVKYQILKDSCYMTFWRRGNYRAVVIKCWQEGKEVGPWREIGSLGVNELLCLMTVVIDTHLYTFAKDMELQITSSDFFLLCTNVSIYFKTKWTTIPYFKLLALEEFLTWLNNTRSQREIFRARNGATTEELSLEVRRRCSPCLVLWTILSRSWSPRLS